MSWKKRLLAGIYLKIMIAMSGPAKLLNEHNLYEIYHLPYTNEISHKVIFDSLYFPRSLFLSRVNFCLCLLHFIFN